MITRTAHSYKAFKSLHMFVYFDTIILLLSFYNRTLELREIGLISQWEKEFEPNTKPCYSENTNHRDSKNKSLQRLSVTNLMGAFALLLFGYILSLLFFLMEIIIFLLKTKGAITV